MPIQHSEIRQIAQAISDGWNANTLELKLHDRLHVDLSTISADGTYPERVEKVVAYLCSQNPSLRRPLLTLMADEGTAGMVKVADALLSKSYFTPTGRAIDAIMLGQRPFMDRADLRQRLEMFEWPNPNSSRVAIIHGEQPGGKSYTWWFLSHLASAWSVDQIQLVRLADQSPPTPLGLVTSAFRLLQLDVSRLPSFKDEPQPAHISPLEMAFQGELSNISRRAWLVIDDLNDHVVAPEVREMAFAMARSAERVKTELFVVLLGYNAPINDETFDYAVRDSPQFPDAGLIAEYVCQVINRDGVERISHAEALRRAEHLWEAFPLPNRDDMRVMKETIERWVAELTKD